MNGPYDDIINLPHHRSNTRAHMSISNRAAQFAPFAALTGYDDAINEEARLTGEKFETAERENENTDIFLQIIADDMPE